MAPLAMVALQRGLGHCWRSSGGIPPPASWNSLTRERGSGACLRFRLLGNKRLKKPWLRVSVSGCSLCNSDSRRPWDPAAAPSSSPASSSPAVPLSLTSLKAAWISGGCWADSTFPSWRVSTGVSSTGRVSSNFRVWVRVAGILWKESGKSTAVRQKGHTARGSCISPGTYTSIAPPHWGQLITASSAGGPAGAGG